MDVNIVSKIGEDFEIPVFGPDEGRRRWNRIRELMYDRQIDCLLICDEKEFKSLGSSPTKKLHLPAGQQRQQIVQALEL